MRVAIIGGGIAGLSAAYELEQARRKGANIEYTLFEKRDRLGGTIASEIVDGAVLERGPDSFITEKTAAAELCRELGLEGELTFSNDVDRKTFVVVHNRLVALPDGLMFLVPTKLIPTALSPLFSLSTKIRMALELLLPPRPSKEDESVASLVKRHFGAGAVDRLADPLLSGIYGGDSTQLSARTVLPKLVEMEQEYGSLSRGMLAAHRKMRAQVKAKVGGNGGAGSGKSPAPKALFTTLRRGMQQLVDALVERIDPACVRCKTPVSSLNRTATGWTVQAGRAEQADSRAEQFGAAQFDAVILASQAWVAGQLLSRVDPALSQDLISIPYSSSITINLLYDESKLGNLPEGFGFLIPASESRSMLACTFVHRKFLGRTPPGKAVLRAFLGGMKNEPLLGEPDERLVATVRRELSGILGENVISLGVEPEHTRVSRWPRAMAQYSVGHQERKQRINERVAALPGLRLAGNAYDGIGVPDCIRLGRKVARELIAMRSLEHQ
jgi:oxygen-dependent protoporphyrinogen oxidase